MAGAFAFRLVPRLAAEPAARGKGGGGGANRDAGSRALVSKKPNKQQHLWIRKETAGSGKKALRLIDAVRYTLAIDTVSKLPNEREAIYGALDKWSAFEPEFPIIAAAKALGMLKRRRQWLRIIQVTKWLMSKGQTHTRSVPKRLFSRMILIYDIHQRPDKVLEIFADMEELGVRPDEDTARRIGKAFVASGQEEKEKHVLEKYLKKWKYIHFNGERVRVRRDGPLA
uniref:Pentatricopeptide repeat-containing protein n=1 Tax=Zea mays TaxID=4577 RepID=A0A804QG24_MAIZE